MTLRAWGDGLKDRSLRFDPQYYIVIQILPGVIPSIACGVGSEHCYALLKKIKRTLRNKRPCLVLAKWPM